MLIHFLTRLVVPARNRPLSSMFESPLSNQIPKSSQTLTPQMVTMTTKSKRSMCPSCSKPASLCLCTRLKTPSLENSVGVTILQHSLEKHHPLNSTRIAMLGLKNRDLVSVSDVNSEAQFVIRLLEPESRLNSVNLGGKSTEDEKDGSRVDFGSERASQDQNFVEDRQCNLASDFPDVDPRCVDEPAMTITIAKYGVITSITHQWVPLTSLERPNFDQVLTQPMALNAVAKGFVVKKLQRKQIERSSEYEEHEEFEITVPPGSLLLFPSEDSVEIGAMGSVVKNLIVLDGTWAKAKRMYSENPWLRLLPHLKLDLDKMSLYSEVRHQPKAGFLSTIESIVYALKAVGDDPEGLDSLLDVFESMVGDQRRCKDQRLSKIAR